MKEERRGWSLMFAKEPARFALHPKGVVGMAFFGRRADAVAFKRDLLSQAGIKTHVVKAVATLATVDAEAVSPSRSAAAVSHRARPAAAVR